MAMRGDGLGLGGDGLVIDRVGDLVAGGGGHVQLDIDHQGLAAAVFVGIDPDLGLDPQGADEHLGRLDPDYAGAGRGPQRRLSGRDGCVQRAGLLLGRVA